MGIDDREKVGGGCMTEGREKPHPPQGVFGTFPNICIQKYAIALVIIVVDKTGHRDVMSS